MPIEAIEIVGIKPIGCQVKQQITLGRRFDLGKNIWHHETEIYENLEQIDDFLVRGFNPFEKYARQIGSFPQVGLKIRNI